MKEQFILDQEDDFPVNLAVITKEQKKDNHWEQTL
jgi:hypothetical protein